MESIPTTNKFCAEHIPKSRKQKTGGTKGVIDDLGFFRTPNGSFWDPDEEYFNHFGYDIHGGSYSKDLEYIPGPDWLSDLGCYPDEKEKYLNPKYDDDEDEIIDEAEFKGDFEDEDYDLSPEELKKMELDDKKLLEQFMTENKMSTGTKKTGGKSKKNKKNKKKKKPLDEEEEGWETVEEDEVEEIVKDK